VIQAWGLLYLLVGLLWWPSAVVGIGAVLTGWRRGRTAAATLADLVEASVDLNVRVLLESMTGDVPTGVIDRATGERLNRQIRKGAKQAAGVPARNSRRGTRPRRRSSGRLRRSRPVVGPSPAAASARVVDHGLLSMLCRRCSRRAGPAQGRDRRARRAEF
jgi:hypothetical protein